MRISRIVLFLILAAGVSLGGAERRTQVRLGGVSVGTWYSRYPGPYWWPYYYSAYYPGPFLWDPFYYPFYHPGYYSGFARGADMGEVKLRTEERKAEVLLDGAYAGQAADLRSMWLAPGAYDLEVRSGTRSYNRRIYVLTGKTLRIDATLESKP